MMDDALQMGLTMQQYLLSHKDVISVGKSNMSNSGKWWVLTPKKHLDEIYAYLNKEFHQYMLH